MEVKQLKFSDPDKSKMVKEILNRFNPDDCLEYVRYSMILYNIHPLLNLSKWIVNVKKRL